MDTSGKGGVLRHTVGLVDPQGVRITSFKAPTAGGARARLPVADREGGCPSAGYVGVFDRSHYEDVLIARVRGARRRRGDRATLRRDQRLRAAARRRGHRRSSSACCTSRAEEQKERLLARLDDPSQALEVQPRRRRRARAVAGVPRRRTRSRSSAPTPSRAVVRRPERQEVVPQPRRRPAAARRPARLDLQWPAADFDVEAERARLADGDAGPSDPAPSRVTRYVTPLREGGSLPGIVEADDLGTYVCKFRGAGQGAAGAGRRGRSSASWPAGSACAPRGWWRSSWTRRSPATRPTRRSRTCSTPASGLNLGIDFLPGAFGYDGDVTGRRRRGAPRCCGWTPSCANVDRTWRNPNLLLWHGDLWVIDHGASLYFHHAWTRRSDRPGEVRRAAVGRRRPRLRRCAGGPATPTPRSPALLDERVFAEVLAEVPDEWLEPVPGSGDARTRLRAAYVAFLVARLGTRQWLPGGAAMSRSRWPTSTSCCAACRGSTARSSSTSGWCSTARPPTSSTSPGTSTGDRLRRARPAARRRPGVRRRWTFVDGCARGDARGGAAARQAARHQRFGFLKAPTSTVLQPGPVHGGVTDDPARELERLVNRLVG